MRTAFLFVAIMVLAAQSARAGIDEELEQLQITKLQAEAGVRAVKSQFSPEKRQYKLATEKYSAAQSAYNSYNAALLDNYKLGVDTKLDRMAELASGADREFMTYVNGLKIQKTLPAIIITAGILIDLAAKVYSYVEQHRAEARKSYADTKIREVMWLDWSKIN
jgi:hypothetical protein